MLDVICLLATCALFAVVGLVAKGVERLGPPVPSTARPVDPDGEARR